MKITANSGEPIYRQIAEQFRDQILNGKLKEGDYLPLIQVFGMMSVMLMDRIITKHMILVVIFTKTVELVVW